MASEITITLSGSESEAQFSGANAWLRNDGAATIYAAKAAGVTAGAAGVVAVPAGGSAPVYGANGRVFLLGTGSVQLIGSDYSTNPFKTATSSGGSGVDEVARAAVNAHAGNAEVHVTAAEKSAWNGKAKLSDIPTSLPADGGNADTVGGFSAEDFVLSAHDNASNQIQIPDNVDVPLWISGNAKLYTRYYSNQFNTGLTNIPGGDSNDWVWYYTDGLNIIATANMSKKVWISAVINQEFRGWTQINSTDADTLDGKHASEFVMHSAYDELAARVAALEAKTQTEGT